jgi:hypothetical protein
MGFVGDLFSGSKSYQAQSGLQPGQLQQTYEQQQDAIKRMQDFASAIAAQGGLANQSQVFQQQQQLAQQLQQMGQGQGPSAAQAMLAQQTGNLGAQQAAIAASQRGASQNVGLVGRQAAMAGMGLQQQAAGQAATLRMQEQLGALEQLRMQQMGMGQVAGQQVGQQMQATTGLSQAVLQAQQQALNAQAQQEQQRTQMALGQEQARQGIVGGLLGGIGAVGSAVAKGGAGGATKGGFDGGMMPQDLKPLPQQPKSILDILKQGEGMAYGDKVPGKAEVEGDSYKNDKVPAMLSPGEIVVPRSAAKDPEKAAAFAKSVAMRGKRKK